MEYVYNGEYVKNTVTIDGVTYPKSEFANLSQLIPVAQVPTLTSTQTIEFHEGSEVNGEWVTFTVREMTDEEKLAVIRTKRDSLLAETDWTGMSDVTMTTEMATYRQALRDLPATVDLNNPVYPTKPE